MGYNTRWKRRARNSTNSSFLNPYGPIKTKKRSAVDQSGFNVIKSSEDKSQSSKKVWVELVSTIKINPLEEANFQLCQNQ